MPDTNFGRFTTGTEVAEALRDNIRGKHVLITGVSPNSLGEAAALAIARGRPALLILASRTTAKLEAVAARVRDQGRVAARDTATLAAGPEALDVRTVVLDLASPASVRAAAAEVSAILLAVAAAAAQGEGRHGGKRRSTRSRLDVLINNAGVSLSRRQLSAECGGGTELTFATNHLGPFLLTNLLLPHMHPGGGDPEHGFHGSEIGLQQQQQQPGPRVVTVSSGGHMISPMRFSDYNFDPAKGEDDLPPEERPRRGLPAFITAVGGGDGDNARYAGPVAYGISKTANVLFTVALRERVALRGVECFAVDPGNIRTNLERDISPEFAAWQDGQPESHWRTHDQGCATMLVAAFDPRLSETDGVYLSDCKISRAARWATDKGKAERLWRLSEQLVGISSSPGGPAATSRL